MDENTTEAECGREFRRLRNERKRKRREESVRLRGAELDPNAPDPSALLETLVNQIVIAVEHDERGEGMFRLHFADGRTAVFEGSFGVEGGERA